MFDPESLMFQTDWKPLEDWFRRRAQAAVDRGEISNISVRRLLCLKKRQVRLTS